MTQYGYGYGYQQPYAGYGQVAATPAVGYSAYQQQRVPYSGATQQTTQQPAAQQVTQQAAQQAAQQTAAQHHHQQQQQQHHHQQQQQQQQQQAVQQQQHHHQQQQLQQPSVGYSPYTASSAASTAQQQQQQQQQQFQARTAAQTHSQTHTQQYHQPQVQQQQQQPKPTPPPPPPGTSQVSASPSYYTASQQQHQQQTAQAQQQQQQAAAAAYYGYGSTYRTPTASSYTPYYGQQQQSQTPPTATAQHHQQQQQRSQGQQHQYQSSVTTVAGGSSGMTGAMRRITGNTTNQYATSTSMNKGATAVGGGASMVTYPAYTPTNYYPAYSKQTNQKSSTGVGVGSSLTSQQQNVVANYIQQKTKVVTGNAQSFFAKRAVTNPQQYYCDVCKISCACAATYKTHLEGKNHKKRLQQQQTVPKDSKSGENYCELCDVVCSNKDAFEAHVRGSKHQKVLTLHRRLGKPIPQMSAGGKTVMVTAPRITFVGGKQLHSTGQASAGTQQELRMYPPGAAVVSATPPKTTPTTNVQKTPTVVSPSPVTPSPSQKATPTPALQATPTSTGGTPEELAEPVGEQFVVSVKGDPKVPHATYKCELCDCYFNDDYAKKMHVKGRRHRLNYKKTYQPDLYVEPTKSQKKEFEKKRIKRLQRNSTEGFKAPGAAVGVPPPPQPSLNELRRQEALELAKRRKQQMMTEDFSHGAGNGGSPSHLPLFPPPTPQDTSPHIPPMYHPPDEGFGWYGSPMPMYPPSHPRPHNPHDDKLVLSKHSAIYPVESEVKAVEAVLVDIEKALKQLSDELLTDACKTEGSTEVKKDESLRELKGAYRVGTHAVGLLLRGECTVELVLMCDNKPTHQLFNEVASRLPAKFESFTKSGDTENVYNITPEPQKASLTIISQVGDHRIQVTITLTSKKMREESEDGSQLATVSGDAGVLDSVPCLAALAALRHTTWFKTAAATLPSCTIILRVLKDICRRVPAWGVLDSWMIELLVPKCIRSANPDYTKPGDVFRRVMESVASGLFLPGGTGLSDPCENGVVDASAKLTAQERANITLSAQHALRLIAFGKLHLVLGVDPLPPPGTPRPHPAYKQPSAGESPGGDASEEVGGADIKASAGVKRESSQEGGNPSGAKKIKLES